MLNPDELRDRLKTCNYAMVKDHLIRVFGGGVVSNELAALLDRFVANAGIESAIPLIERHPEFLAFFEMALAGGFTETIYREQGSAIFRADDDDDMSALDEDFSINDDEIP